MWSALISLRRCFISPNVHRYDALFSETFSEQSVSRVKSRLGGKNLTCFRALTVRQGEGKTGWGEKITRGFFRVESSRVWMKRKKCRAHQTAQVWRGNRSARILIRSKQKRVIHYKNLSMCFKIPRVPQEKNERKKAEK